MRRISGKWMHGKLQIPGGHTEEGESPLRAVLREAREELGLAIGPDDVELVAVAAVKDGNNEYVALQFNLLYPEKYAYEIMEPHKCSELVWADIDNLPDDTIDIFKVVVGQAVAGNSSYVQIGYPGT